MNNIYLIVLFLILLFCSGFSNQELNIVFSYQPNVDRLETIFKTYLPIKEGILYTKVPRGLIVSIDERYFFNEGETRIKESSLCILDIIIVLLHKLSNYCVVEDHTETDIFLDSSYKQTWELSLVRSSNIVEYMIECGKLPSTRLFALGYGQYMPFLDNVSKDKNGMNNRIDFVIIEYEAKR